VDQSEFTRRIEVYLKTDLPDVGDPRRIAEALAPRLYQYLRQPPDPTPELSTTLQALVPQDALLFFGAAWDAYSQQYRPVVQDAARRMGRRLVEIDVDDPVGGAIAAVLRVANTPSVASLSVPGLLVGVRAIEEIEQRFHASP
jgi:hypothetical protein